MQTENETFVLELKMRARECGIYNANDISKFYSQSFS